MKFNAGFIYVAPNCDPKQQNAVIPGESIDLYVYGGSRCEELGRRKGMHCH